MRRQRRFISRSKNGKLLHSRTNLIAVLTFVVILTGFSLHVTHEDQRKQILSSYCADFGFGSKTLTLMKDGTFSFRYYGCSQSNGSIGGRWTLNADIIELYATESGQPLYYQIENKLLATDTRKEEFVLCDDYEPIRWASENPN